MSYYAKILSLSYDSAEAVKSTALKSYWRSVRLLKESGTLNPKQPSYITNILLCGNCIDPENRNLYVFYIDTSVIGSAWIIEINIDTRVQTVVYYDKYNAIGFNQYHKIYNARVVHGRLIWTDNLNPIYQMDIERAKRSFYHKIGYGQYPTTVEWGAITTYSIDQIVSNGNNFYKSLIYDNLIHEPKVDDGTRWKKLCLIEDAYYSMNVENFYFEPVPPKHPPVVEYQSDSTRKINNLRQTLFQVAYRYVYMDWRKSTYSPASIVPVPQAEEESATGLANEQISLNNKLQITVNSGGEEVRAVEIIGRSSEDVSTWFLIETIEKFSSQERAFELSLTSELDYTGLSITIPVPTAVGLTIIDDFDETSMALSVLWARVVLSYVSLTVETMSWLATYYGSAEGISTTITISPGMAKIWVKPSWITVILVSRGIVLMVGSEVNSGDVLLVYPTAANDGNEKTGYVIFMSNGYMDAARISVTQEGVPPLIPISTTISVDPDDTSGLIIINSSSAVFSGDISFNINVTINNPSYGPADPFNLYWRTFVNGFPYGAKLISVIDEFENTINISLLHALVPDDILVIYLSANPPEIEVHSGLVPAQLDVLWARVVLSYVSLTVETMSWLATYYGSAEGISTVLTVSPDSVRIIVKSDWLTVVLVSRGLFLSVGSEIDSGEELLVYPTAANDGNARIGYVIFMNNGYMDSARITASQDASLTPPVGIPVSCVVLADPDDDSGLVVLGQSADATSGNKIITITVKINVPGYGAHDRYSIHWWATINGTLRGAGLFTGSNSFLNDIYVTRQVAVDVDPLVGDIIIIYLSANLLI